MEIKILQSTRRKLEIHVDGCPPWKQSTANDIERKRQKENRVKLEKKAKEIYEKERCLILDIILSIKYKRNKGRADPCNIIGGIADALEILYLNDKEIKEVHYLEGKSEKDEYWIILEGLFYDQIAEQNGEESIGSG